jgi:hypothetical protein
VITVAMPRTDHATPLTYVCADVRMACVHGERFLRDLVSNRVGFLTPQILADGSDEADQVRIYLHDVIRELHGDLRAGILSEPPAKSAG